MANAYIKFHKWSGLEADSYLNYDQFHIDPLVTEIVANFKNVSNAKIDIDLSSAGGVGNYNLGIDFKDPWLNDWNSTYGIKNLGEDALFKPLQVPYNLSDSSSYHGVFLGQGYTDPSKPYYSVKAQSTQNTTEHGEQVTWYFQNWGGTGVTYQNTTSTETAVVFNQPNATATAEYKGTRLSDNPNAFANNSQRKFVRTDNGDLHMVYEDNGKVWYERSADNGATWQLANNGKPLSGAYGGKLPAIDYKDNSISIIWQENYGGVYRIKLTEYFFGMVRFPCLA